MRYLGWLLFYTLLVVIASLILTAEHASPVGAAQPYGLAVAMPEGPLLDEYGYPCPIVGCAYDFYGRPCEYEDCHLLHLEWGHYPTPD